MINDFVNELDHYCGFCGRSTNELHEKGDCLVKGIGETYICTTCVSTFFQDLESMIDNTGESRREINLKKPSDIKTYLDQYIIGQEKAKEILSVAIYNHWKMLKLKEANVKDVELEKSNIMLVGPSGCGKTAIIKHLSKLLNVPFAMADITSFSSTGYAGYVY